MSCCCETNVKAAYVIGIIFAILSVVLCFGVGFGFDLLLSVPILLIFLASLVLIYGGYKRNRTAILIWMVFAIILLIGVVILAIAGLVIIIIDFDSDIINSDIIILTVSGISFAIFLGWSIHVVKNARNEIELDSPGKQFKPLLKQR